jgi:adenylylsulfate reductase subunit B
MSIRINQEKCVGCKRCIEVCPGTLIDLQDKKAVMKYPKNCWGCVSCVKECKAGAIDFYLGADIGGTGSVLNVIQEGDILHWVIKKPNGEETTIDVDRRNANQY